MWVLAVYILHARNFVFSTSQSLMQRTAHHILGLAAYTDTGPVSRVCRAGFRADMTQMNIGFEFWLCGVLAQCH